MANFTIQPFKEGVKKTWEAFKFYSKDPLFIIPVVLIVLVGIYLTIREINYDKWYPEDSKITEIEVVEEVITMDSLQMETLNLKEILNNCPVDTEFYSTGFGTVKFVEITDTVIKVKTDKDVIVDYNFKGYCLLVNDSTCTLFPSKMNHNWFEFEKTW